MEKINLNIWRNLQIKIVHYPCNYLFFAQVNRWSLGKSGQLCSNMSDMHFDKLSRASSTQINKHNPFSYFKTPPISKPPKTREIMNCCNMMPDMWDSHVDTLIHSAFWLQYFNFQQKELCQDLKISALQKQDSQNSKEPKADILINIYSICLIDICSMYQCFSALTKFLALINWYNLKFAIDSK